MAKTSNDVVIEQLEPIEHVLQNPDMYFGDVKVSSILGYTYDPKNNIVNREKSVISNVLLKMTDEILMNATDNAIKSYNSDTPMTKVDILINTEKKYISVRNDGLSIPIKKDKSGKYLPEIAFTNLFSSSNFNNNRTGAGKNGVGASITNVMSKQFIIDIVCDNIHYRQNIKNNCKLIYAPVIEKCNAANYVKIVFVPDMKKILKIANNSSDPKEIFMNTIPYINKRVLDVNMLLNSYDITVNYNNKPLPNMNFRKYTELFIGKNDNILSFSNNIFELIITENNKNAAKTNISFVNNIAVTNGVHMKNIFEQIEDAVAKKLKISSDDKDKALKNIKSRLCVFMKCTLKNPMFDGQSKNKLQTADNINDIKLSKYDINEIIGRIDFDEIVNGKKIDDLNKNIKIPRARKLLIDKLTDANEAGSRNSNKCTLFLCEGDSAAKLAKDGIAYLGHDYYGVYPLGGKPINIREGNISKMENNKTILNIAKILGLPLRTKAQINKRDLDTSKLRYGKIVMLKDADTDGAHIMGLVINLIEQLYPELLEIEGFFNEFITPMIKLIIPLKDVKSLKIDTTNNKQAGTIVKTQSNIIYPFYNTNDYNKFITKYSSCKSLKPVYIKGLGGHNQSESIEYFKNYNNNVIPVSMNKQSYTMLDLAFNKKLANKRKDMLATRTGETALPRYVGQSISCADFIKNDWLDYSYDACLRAIPSAIDGLKPSQRKVLYVLINNYKAAKSNTEQKIDNFKKVFQICGEVANKGYYHHGDQSLNGTIIAMAQDFTGSNNLPLLAYSGSFGSRDMNGDDAGAPRYISATIHEVARYIFPKDDDQLLTANIEDNAVVEPVYYVPIVPMVLINGSIGIGTGYSTYIPQHNALDIIQNVINRLNGVENNFEPKYNYYKGSIELNDYEDGYYVNGVYDINKNIVNIKEIPFDISKEKFITLLKELYEKNIVLDYRENKSSSVNDFDFTIEFNPTNSNMDDRNLDREWVEKTLHLVSVIKTTNLVAFNKQSKLTQFSSVDDLFEEWFKVRHETYIKRKAMILEKYEAEIKTISEKARFIKMVINNEISIMMKSAKSIEEELIKNKFEKINDSYNHLLNLPIYSLTKEKYDELMSKIDKLTSEYKEYKETSIKKIWLSELNELKTYINNNYDVDKW